MRVVVTAILSIAFVTLSGRATRAVAAVGVPVPLAFAAVMAIGAIVIGLTLVGVRREKLKPLAFFAITLAVIAAAQLALQTWFDDLGWSAEVQWFGSWLIAILVIGTVADMFRKCLGIEFPPNRRRS